MKRELRDGHAELCEEIRKLGILLFLKSEHTLPIKASYLERIVSKATGLTKNFFHGIGVTEVRRSKAIKKPFLFDNVLERLGLFIYLGC